MLVSKQTELPGLLEKGTAGDIFYLKKPKGSCGTQDTDRVLREQMSKWCGHRGQKLEC